MRDRPFRPSRSGALALGAVCLFLAACGSGSTGISSGLSQDQLNAIGNGVAAEIEGASGLMTVFEVSHPSASARRVRTPLLAPSLLGLPLRGVRGDISPANCPTFSPNPPVDTDHDGVPDDATLTFTQPQCKATDSTGFVFEVTGTVEISDPTPTDSGVASNGKATNFMIRFLDPQGHEVLATTRDGLWSTAAQGVGLAQTYQMQTGVAINGTPALQVTSDWTNTFTPAAHQALFMGAEPPAGALAVAGKVTINDGADAFTLDLATAIPLQFDPVGCKGQTTSFTGGEVTGTFSGPSNPSGVVHIQWANCGLPSYTFSRQ